MRSAAQFYHSKSWERLRESVLAEAEYKDQLELRAGRTIEADTVHHIFPREKYPEYELCRWNMIAISSETHEELHARATGRLSPLGWSLLLETAEKQGIPISRTFLVIGLPGSGKTTFVKRNLRDGIAYDLDYIAAAFRLSLPHQERHEPARKLANALVKGFASGAGEYVSTIWVIRSAPSLNEFLDIDPCAVYVCNGSFIISGRKDYKKARQEEINEMKENIEEIRAYCQYNNIDIYEVGG